MLTQKRLREISVSHDLDYGGYEYENAGDWQSILGENVAILDSDGAFEGVHGSLRDLGIDTVAPLVMAFEPSGIYANRDKQWPKSLPMPSWGGEFKLIHSGILLESERECICEGEESECEKCQGDGFYVSEGGNYAFYAFEETVDEDNEDSND